MNSAILLTLKEIADWQLTTRDKVSPGACWAELPSFQRGLVWSAAQIEVLWDSILRRIPIGAFSLLPKHGNEQYSKAGNATCNGGFFLLDGQQRANAIALGFRRFPCDDNLAESILWIDVLPYEDVKARSNRKHFFYVTTPARPWGYRIEDAKGENRSGRVSVSQYRTALEEMGCDGAAIAKPTPARLWPVCARLPVPVSILRGLSDETRTAEGVLAAGGKAPWVGHFRKTLASLRSNGKVYCDNIDASINTICERLFATAEARVMAMIAPDSLSANPGDGERDGDLSEIALYFSRLNRGGTMPDREDLDYSILKSILPGLHAIDVCAANRMHPSRLAHIVMLAFLSTEAKPGWKRDLSRRDIMNLRDKSAFAKYVADGLPCDIERIDEWLMGGVSDSGYGIPKFLRAQIARQQPNLYRFLLMLAMKMRALSIDGAPAFGKLVTAFCTTLAWFGNDSALDFSSLSGKVDEIVAASSDPAETRKTFGKWMAVQVEKEAMVLPPTLDYFRKIEAATLSGDMDAIRAAWSDPAQSGAANRIWYWNGTCGRGIVLYACREYMGRTFGDYDPAAAVWSEDSCPWDYDHIVPQAWLKGTYHGKHHELVYEFLNSIGNISPIPFGANRSKHDTPPGRSEFYAKCADGLFIDFEIDGRRPGFVDQYRIVEDDANDAFDFACMTSRRMVALYAEWWNTLEIGALLAECRLEDRQLQTEKIASCLRKVFPGKEGDIRFVYVAPDGRQLDVVNAWDWSRPWIACGIEGWWCKRDAHKKVRSFLCMTFQNGCVEYGVRRHPDETLLDGTGEWWINDQCHEAALSAPALMSDMEESFIGYAKSIIARSMDGAESAEWFEV